LFDRRKGIREANEEDLSRVAMVGQELSEASGGIELTGEATPLNH
jgi:hypothetical protein